MQRIEILRLIYSDIEDDIVVTIMGAVAAELYSLGHRRNFFYLQHAMGLASSMGLGLALAKPGKRVIVFDGDGSLLMNLGTLSTLAWYAPKNLIHVVFDNESLLSSADFRRLRQRDRIWRALLKNRGICIRPRFDRSRISARPG